MVGSYGSGPGQFDGPGGLAFDSKGNMYVTDRNNHRVQKFDSEGQFLIEWGSEGSGEGQFLNPVFIAIDSNDNVYVGERDSYPNYDVQKFTSEGKFISKLSPEEWVYEENKDFNWHAGIGIDENDYVYIAWRPYLDKFSPDGKLVSSWKGDVYGGLCEGGSVAYHQGNVYVGGYNGVGKFSSNGQFLEWWSSTYKNIEEKSDKLHWPIGLTRDSEGNIYVVEYWNSIAKFNSAGKLIDRWRLDLSGYYIDGYAPPTIDIAVNEVGEIYVSVFDVLYEDHHIMKYSSSGEVIGIFGKGGSLDGEFINPSGVALDRTGNLYVVDTGNQRIQKFDADSNFILKWGSAGNGDGEFDLRISFLADVTVDSLGNVYVADTGNNRVQKFTSDGKFITKWGSYGTEDGNFSGPSGLAIDNIGNVYVVDKGNSRIQKFTSEGVFITKLGSWGTNPGQMRNPESITVDPVSENIYVTDYGNNRAQVFQKTLVSSNNKAIIVAGGGPFSGNNLWDATQMCSNFAYRTLTYQGFTKESIYYLSSDTDLDLDNNGVADDVDGDATNTNLQQAITTWAKDADSLVLYLADHGGTGTFRMSGTETLSVSDLDSWLDTLQGTLSGRVTVVYDACESGSFISSLTPPSGKERVVITSTSPNESAKFVTQGSVSFSNYFWTHIFNGVNVKDSFVLTNNALATSFDDQTPLLDANGNGVGNEAQDFTLVQGSYIGNGTVISGDAPVIGSVSPAKTITGTSSASLYAASVTDSDGIARVWAVIRSPDYNQGSSDNPVTSLPSVDLMPVGGDRYEGTYSGFNIAGTYQTAIYARDRIGNTSIPKLTTVSVNNPLRRRAIIVAGGPQSDSLWSAIQKNAGLAYDALTFQGYTNDDIYFMSPVTFTAGVDVLPTLSNIQYAIDTWAKTNTQDIVLYLLGNGGNGTFKVNETENLSGSDLDTWLDSLQTSMPGKVTVIYEACRSGSFLPLLTPPSGKERILISSASGSQSAYFISGGDISFSKFFWGQVANGSNVRNAFLHGKDAIKYACRGQTPQMDDNGNGTGNEKADGVLARNYTIGAGIMLAGDDPIIGSASPAQTLSGEMSATIWAKDVTTTNTISNVWAVITPPGYTSDPSNPVTDLPTLALSHTGGGRYEGIYSGFSSEGTYEVAVHAIDQDGNVSLPFQTTVSKSVVLEQCTQCTGDQVNLTGVTFESGTSCECSAATSITIGSGVTIKSGATITFKAPTVKIQSGFKAEEGATVNIKQQ